MPVLDNTQNYNLNKFVSGSDDWGPGMNNNMDIIDNELNTGRNPVNISYDNSISGLTANNVQDALDELSANTKIMSSQTLFVLFNGGDHCQVIRASSTKVYLMPVPSPFGSFMGAVLSDGTYLETTGKIELDITNIAHHLDGFGQCANQMYDIMFFGDGGNLNAGFVWKPKTTINGANPQGLTTPISLNQVNSKDVGFLFGVGSGLRVWENGSDFETPVFSYGGSYNPDGSLTPTAKTATGLTLNKDILITDYADGAEICQLDNFAPLNIADGTQAVSAYKDTGWSVKTDASGNLENFVIIGNDFYYTNGDGSANYDYLNGIEAIPCATTATVNKIEYVPVDSVPILVVGGDASRKHMSFCYWQDYGESMTWGGQSVIKESAKTKHGLIKLALGYSGTAHNIFVRGYKKRKF